MRFLVDENLPPSLAELLRRSFPGSAFVHDLGLTGVKDDEIWWFATENDYAIITRDVDFQHLSFLRGAPPKVVLVRCGAIRYAEIVSFVAMRMETIQAFAVAAEEPILILE